MQVRDIMTTDLASCSPDADLREVASMMVECDCGSIPVLDPDTHRAVGIITDRDIVCRAVASGQNPVGMKARDLMTMPVMAVTPETSLEDCLAKMEAAQLRRMLVVDDQGGLCGLVAQADIARSAPEHATAELVRDVSKPDQSDESWLH